MSSTPPALHELARRLLAGEPARVEASNGDAGPAGRVCERLRMPLTKLAGASGFSSLLSRALALARRQAPSLGRLRIGGDGSLSAPDDARQDFDAPNTSDVSSAAYDAGSLLVAELLGLLITLIGESLTLGLVREAWPDVSAESITLRTKDEP